MVSLRSIAKTYSAKEVRVDALIGVDLEIESGEFLVIRGPSGSGKTTLLMIIAAMLSPSSGTVSIGGQKLHKMAPGQMKKFREQTIGFVFQMFHLIPYLNVLDNVALAGRSPGLNDRGVTLLRRFGMGDRLLHKPSELSAGEKQRVAIARALLNKPQILLADEPTGNLDPKNAGAVMTYLKDFNHQGGTVIVASHTPEVEQHATRVIQLEGGRIVS